MTSQKIGASAFGFQRMLGLGSYRTAWTWLHKLRRAMLRGRDRLAGRVEVDETYLGGPGEGRHGRKLTPKKALSVVAAQEDAAGIERIPMRRVRDASAASLHPFVQEAIAPGSVVHTDGLDGYAGVEHHGYRHEVTVQKASAELMPRVHRVVALLKRWLLGTHQGAVSHAHLNYHLDEFIFRLNRQTSRSLFVQPDHIPADVVKVP